MRKLTLKQKRFCDEYIICANATEAAIKAGYAKKFAGPNAGSLLRSKAVKDYIDERLKILEDAKIAKQEEVLTFLTSVMRGEIKDEVLKMSSEGICAKDEIVTPGKDRVKAAELLGKRYRMFTEKTEITGAIESKQSKIDDVIEQLKGGD